MTIDGRSRGKQNMPPVGIDAEYLLGTEDVSLARPGTEFAARIGVTATMVPGSHLAMWTRPREIAPAIAAACS